jgi:acetolactate synthase-1/2/3 large subunit
VFGHPGGEVLDLIDALEQSGIQFVLTGHESAAAFMAGTTGRLTGVPGVCLSTLGPGACNLILGVGSAFLDRDPLVALSGSVAPGQCATRTKQNLRLNDLFAPVTKWSLSLDGVQTAKTVASAMAVASRAPRGPVFLSLAPETAANADSPEGIGPPEPGFIANHGDLAAVIRHLKAARRPVAVVGLALDPVHDSSAVRRFLAQTGLAFTVLPQAKGVADETSERFLGTVCGGGDGLIVSCLSTADCLLGIGFDPVESAQDWHLRLPVCSVANTIQSFGNYRPVAECAGDVSDLLSRIALSYEGSGAHSHSEIQHVRTRTHQALCPPSQWSACGLSPYHVIRSIREATPPETLVACDVGAHKMLLSQLWQAPSSNSFLVSNGLSAMGYGVPATIAASLLYPSRPVIGVIGDGGFGMMVQELETARRLRLNPLFVLFCDHELAIVKIAQHARQSQPVGTDFGPVNWVAVASGFGANALAPGSLHELELAVRQWLSRRELTVLAVPIDASLYVGLSY